MKIFSKLALISSMAVLAFSFSSTAVFSAAEEDDKAGRKSLLKYSPEEDRLAELVAKQRTDGLTEKEKREFIECSLAALAYQKKRLGIEESTRTKTE